jgi:drug/metabolite transporter (DMT)-like permease
MVCSGLQGLFSSDKSLGNLLALIGAFLSAGYLLVGRKVRPKMDLSTYTYLVYTFAAIVLTGIVVISHVKVTGYSSQSYVWLLALAIIPQIIGHSAFNWALKYLSAAFVSIALLGEPVGSIILAFLLLKEKPTILEIVGGILILIGIVIATGKPRQKLKRNQFQQLP